MAHYCNIDYSTTWLSSVDVWPLNIRIKFFVEDSYMMIKSAARAQT